MERREIYFAVEPLSALGFVIGVLGVGVPGLVLLRRRFWNWRNLGI